MIHAQTFLDQAAERGFDFYSGVPCSFLTPIINRVISDKGTEYVGAASEGEAVGIASGAWLAGRSTVVMCQNSGLGNTINPLTSLNWPFRIPTMMLVTLRGEPGLKDEPQHELMGEITARLLDDIRVPNGPFPESDEAIPAALESACASMASNDLPFGFIVRKGTVADEALDEQPTTARAKGMFRDRAENGERPTRYAALEQILAFVPDEAAIIATTGKASVSGGFDGLRQRNGPGRCGECGSSRYRARRRRRCVDEDGVVRDCRRAGTEESNPYRSRQRRP
jgi:phosphonopyruvate decarboxylase